MVTSQHSNYAPESGYRRNEDIPKPDGYYCNSGQNDSAPLDSARKRVKHEFSKLMNVYNEAYLGISNIEFRHNKLINQQDAYKKIFEDQLGIVKAEAKYAFEQIVWDHLVIGFFGETNAGKSTIIEALRLKYSATPGDHMPGDIIGNGQADFTKEASEYDLNIDGHRVTLIDVPGIEGDEAKYSNIIKRALCRAHLIFYVQSKNKKPDNKIAEKIQSYLADWTRVYAIHNVRGNVGAYEDEEMLDTILTDSNLKVSREISEVFRSTLKHSYNDIITIQGLLAVSVCDYFVNDTKKHRNYEKACRIFGTPENALKYSNFYALVSLLKSCTADVSDNIFKSNIQKIIGLRKKGYAVIRQTEKNKLKDITDFREALDKLRRDINILVINTNRIIDQDYKAIITREFNWAKRSICDIIDNTNYKNTQKKDKSADIAQLLPVRILDALEDSIRETCSQLLHNIKNKIREFQRISVNLPESIQFDEFKLDIDLKYDLENLNINLEDTVNAFSTIAMCTSAGFGLGTVFPVVGNVIGAIGGAVIGTGISITRSLTDGGGRGKAKQKVTAELEVCKKETIGVISAKIDSVHKQLERQRKSIDDKIKSEMISLEDSEDIISQLSHKLKYISDND